MRAAKSMLCLQDMKTVVDDWNKCDFAVYTLHEDAKSSIMGGWRTIAKFLSTASMYMSWMVCLA